MVKGTTRQVILVKGTGEKLFEQAIFLVRDDALRSGGVTEEALLQQARQACAQTPPRLCLRAKLFWACCGAGIVAFLWLMTAVLI